MRVAASGAIQQLSGWGVTYNAGAGAATHGGYLSFFLSLVAFESVLAALGGFAHDFKCGLAAPMVFQVLLCGCLCKERCCVCE